MSERIPVLAGIGWMVTALCLAVIVGSAALLLACTQGRVVVRSCGMDPNMHRSLVVEEQPPNRDGIRLQAISREGNGSIVILSSGGGARKKWLESHDRGTTWSSRSEPHSTTMLNFEDWPDIVDSPTDSSVTYERLRAHWQPGESRKWYRVTRDGGSTWENLVPVLEAGMRYDEMRIYHASWQVTSRVYAVFWLSSGGGGIFVSDDYGKHFRLVTKEVVIAVESQSDASIMYGLTGYSSKDSLRVSTDGGTTWHTSPAAQDAFSSMFGDGTTYQLKTWEYRADLQEWSPLVTVQQIATDADNPSVFYLQSFKGLFRSSDEGKTFVLLQIGADKVYGILDFGADVIQSGTLYATTSDGEFYRSFDFGCSWQLVHLPQDLLD